MKRFIAFLIIAAVLGIGGFILLGSFNRSENFATVESPIKPAAPPPPTPKMVQFQALSTRIQGTSSFRDAKIAFETPGRMQLGKSKDVKLLLNLKKTIEELRTELGKEFPTQGATIDSSPIMEASLSGGAFDIRAGSPARQAVREAENTTWEWSVTPREKGNHTLKLRLYAIVTLQGATAPMEVKTFERDIPVDVSIPELVLGFVKENIQLVWLALVVPIAGFLSRLFKFSSGGTAG